MRGKACNLAEIRLEAAQIQIYPLSGEPELMARVTIEDSLKQVNNMYELVHVATIRTRQLFSGASRTVRCKNKEVVTALREIAAGHHKIGEDLNGQKHQT